MSRTPVVKGLLKSIEDKASMRRSAYAPADNATSECVDDKCHVDKPLPSRDIREIAHPESVWRGSLKWRFTRSSGLTAVLSEKVVRIGLPRITP